MKKILSLLLVLIFIFSISVGFASETEKIPLPKSFVASWDIIITKLYGEPQQIKLNENYDNTSPFGDIVYTFDVDSVPDTINLIYDGQSKFWLLSKNELIELQFVINAIYNINIPFTDLFALMRFMEKL